MNTVLHPVLDLSIHEQVPGNVSLILKVPSAVFWVKTCIEIGCRMLLSLCCLDLNAIVLVCYLFETIFVCFLSIFYNLAHSHIKVILHRHCPFLLIQYVRGFCHGSVVLLL
jgi:hypothetical protein